MSRICFGTFEVDTRSGELRRKGSRVKLQAQPFQVLALLLERPGEVVTREELTGQLWSGNTFVDFERGLNKAVNKLREALQDDAEKPRFIETLPQRGYRFIAEISVSKRDLAVTAEEHDALLSPGSPRIDSIAVLPLDNHSGDPAQEYFSDGMTEELISAISKISSLRVISRTSVMTYKGAHKSLPAIARELRVDAVVEGSVARSGDKVRVTAQLIYAPDDRHLWAGRYERELRDVLQLQAEIAQDIASQVHKLLDPRQLSPFPARKVHPQAFETALRANFFRDKMTPAELAKGAELYAEAVAIDPNYAQAYANLSQCLFYMGLFGMGPCRELFLKAKTNALKALQLDETVAAAQNALAAIHILHDWDWARAEAVCRRGVELRPGDSAARLHLADYMSIQARHDEAIVEFKRALEFDPISRVYIGYFGLLCYRARRYDESIAHCQKALDIDPYYCNAMWFMALSLEQNGQLPEAIAQLEKAVNISGAPLFLALLSRAHALSGNRTKALDILDRLKVVSQQRYVSPFDFAVVHIGLGDLTSGFAQLEEAYQQRVFRIIELTMPMFDNLHSDPRWSDLVQRIGLPL
jgi:TolB-like protein/Tfp pilus assembly protein PilF